ncbi:MAG: nitroreductase family protein [Candidatus Pacearchaeota archaeon]
MEFDSIVRKRRSVRKFKSKKPDWRDIIKAVDSALKIPLAGNIPCIKYIIIDDSEKINKIKESCQQDFISKVHYLVVVCSDDKDVIRSYGEKGRDYVKQQVGASIHHFLLKLTDLGLSGCWVGFFIEDHIKGTLKIPDNINVEAVIPLGYSDDKTGMKRKPNLDRSLYFNEYKYGFMKMREEIEGR